VAAVEPVLLNETKTVMVPATRTTDSITDVERAEAGAAFLILNIDNSDGRPRAMSDLVADIERLQTFLATIQHMRQSSTEHIGRH